ncbi:hypothetical protein A4A49_41921, partial [Nicotiana attenuata]
NVILVGQEFDGARISFAMELFLSKVSKAAFVTVANMQRLILFFSLREYFGMEKIGSRFATNIVHNPNLEDKVLIGGGGIVMNRPITDYVIGLGAKTFGPVAELSKTQRVMWDPG